MYLYLRLLNVVLITGPSVSDFCAKSVQYPYKLSFYVNLQSLIIKIAVETYPSQAYHPQHLNMMTLPLTRAWIEKTNEFTLYLMKFSAVGFVPFVRWLFCVFLFVMIEDVRPALQADDTLCSSTGHTGKCNASSPFWPQLWPLSSTSFSAGLALFPYPVPAAGQSS